MWWGIDSDGFLVREELESLVVWVFESFFPSRAKLSDDEAKSEAVKLLKYLDKNEDAQVDYPEVSNHVLSGVLICECGSLVSGLTKNRPNLSRFKEDVNAVRVKLRGQHQ